ncbi:hypothetical protein JG688_00016840 [Phytophthora aleatoria]|uniref:Uncharacterized protein n=1 Tax=Phytophthora aleatoria TaxID=2496075 RepID=A0A8J5I7M7_9STRA|nr:hypothetical protein JG688_00016840 [Phytophthora aleatoria]
MASKSAPPNHSELPAESLDIENDDENDQVDPQLLSQRLGYLLQTVIMSKDEIKRTGALINSVKCDWGDCQEVMSLNLIELRKTMAACVAATTTSTPVMELMTLWSIVHEAIDNDFIHVFQTVKVVVAETSAVSVEAHKVFDSPFSKTITDKGLSGLDGVFAQSRESIDAALDQLRGGGIAAAGTLAVWLARAGLPPLLRLEIARDFFQTVGLFFSGLYTAGLNYIEEHHTATDMSRFLNGVRSIYDVVSINVVSINVVQVVQNAAISRGLMIDLAMWLLIAAVGAVYLSYIWFACSGRHLHRRDEEIRQGHEADTWAELATTQKKRVAMFTYVITACLTIYLPLTRLCLEIVAESAAHLLFTNGTQYSEENSAFRVSNGFRNTSDLLSSSYFTDFSEINSSSSISDVFVGDFNGSLDDDNSSAGYPVVNVSALTNSGSVGTSASELVVARFKNDDTSWVAVVASAVILLATFTLPLPRLLIRTIAQNRPTGSLENSKVTYDLDGEEVPFDDKVYERLVQRDPNQLRCPYRSLYASFEQRWSYYKVMQLVVKLCLALIIVFVASDNIVLRAIILCAFYACVVALSSYSTPFIDPLNNLMEISGKLTALVTFTALEQAIVASGIHRVRDRWQGEEDAHNAKLRQTLRSALEGVDVYWDDATGTRDGHLDSKTCFGKMYVVPYPFHCVVVYDDCKDETIIRDDKDGKLKLAKLLFLNFTPQIMAKRDLRHKLRVLSDRDTSINFPFSRPEQVTVPDGVIVTTDAYGNTQTTPRFSTVTFTCYYTNGVIGVSSKGDAKGRIMAEGFNVTMTYRDGHGKAVAPYTGMVYEQSGRVAVMGKSHIGLTSTMTESSELRKIFTQTQEVWEAGIPELRQQHQEYRRTLQDKHAQANATLTDAFWYFVYNNANLSREKLEEHFKRRELNPRLKLLAATHQVALDSLYLRMQFILSHPAVTFWYIFWDDVYVRNAEMRQMGKRFESKQIRF